MYARVSQIVFKKFSPIIAPSLVHAGLIYTGLEGLAETG